MISIAGSRAGTWNITLYLNEEKGAGISPLHFLFVKNIDKNSSLGYFVMIWQGMSNGRFGGKKGSNNET